MPTMTNPKTGETKEISMEEFIEAMRGGKMSIRQEVHHADGSVTSSVVYGNNVGDGVDRSVNIFGTIKDVLKPVSLKAKEIKEANTNAEKLFFMDNVGADYEVTIDDTSLPMMHIITCTKESVHVARYIRDERKTVGKPLDENTYAFINGKLCATVEEVQGGAKLLLLAFGVYEIRKLLEERGVLQELKKLDNRSSGVAITTNGEEVITKVVRGRNRPDLPCLMFGGIFQNVEDAVLMRPYMDELMGDALRAGMSVEDMISETEEGDPDCMESLAQAYLNGDGIEQDFKKSAYWLEKLAETDNSVAQFNIGLFYAKGCGVKRDFEKAAEWMKKAVDNGNEDAHTPYEMYSKAAEDLKKAEAGDAVAQAEISKLFTQIGGSLSQYGSGDDYKASFEWAEKSAGNGNLDGMYYLALCYEHGRGTVISPLKAAAIYEKAAGQGHAPSQWNLAVCYLNGDGVQRDATKGYFWAYQAADQGNELAINGLQAQGKTIKQVIERYSDPECNVTLEGTQYEGRADRCEKICAGMELQYKIIKDKNDEDALECFYNGGSVGLIFKWAVGDVITLLRLERVDLKIKVKSCIPKSKRGARARNADVHLSLNLTERKPEAHIVLDKKDPEKTEAKKSDEEINKLVKDIRSSFGRLRSKWILEFENRAYEIWDRCSVREEENQRSLNNILKFRREIGNEYEKLIVRADEEGKQLFERNGSFITVKVVRDVINELIEGEHVFDADFDAKNLESMNWGNKRFFASDGAHEILDRWTKKYEMTPEFLAEKKRERITEEIKAAENALYNLNQKRSRLDEKEERLSDEIVFLDKQISSAEENYDASVSAIESRCREEIRAIQDRLGKLRTEKTEFDKAISEIRKQTESLPFFKFSLKKELAKKLEEEQKKMLCAGDDIRNLETELENIKQKMQQEITALQVAIDSDKEKLVSTKTEIGNLTGEREDMDKMIESQKKRIEDLKTELAQVV